MLTGNRVLTIYAINSAKYYAMINVKESMKNYGHKKFI